MPSGTAPYATPVESPRNGFKKLFRKFTKKSASDTGSSSTNRTLSSSSSVVDSNDIDFNLHQRQRSTTTESTRRLVRDSENITSSFSGGGSTSEHGTEGVPQTSSHTRGSSIAVSWSISIDGSETIRRSTSAATATSRIDTTTTRHIPLSPALSAVESRSSSPPVEPRYSEQVTTPPSYQHAFPSPPPTLSPPTPVLDQPTLAGRIQNLLDSISIFSRAREDDVTSHIGGSNAGEQNSASDTIANNATLEATHPRPRYDSDVLPDTSSIMVYSPLLPTDMDLVELAETILFDVEGPRSPTPVPVEALPTQHSQDYQYQEEVQVHMQPSSSTTSSWTSWWPFNSFSSWSQPAAEPQLHSPASHEPGVFSPMEVHTPLPVIYTPLPVTSPPSAHLELLPNSPYGGQMPLPNVYTPLPPNSPLLSPGPQFVPLNLNEPQLPSQPGQDSRQTQRIWVPSKTMLSIQAMWWGYRLYIPPPIMLYLSSASLSTARRTAILTSALTWFFNNLPISLLPLPLQPLLVLLQSLTPLVALVGGAIAAIWGLVESYNEGFGVILTATWLMPIALVPSTWPPEEWPISPEVRSRELDGGARSLDSLVQQTRVDGGAGNGVLPTPPATSIGASPCLRPDVRGILRERDSSNASPPTPIDSPRSDAVSPPTSPRSTWTSPPGSPLSTGSSSPALTSLSVDSTPRLPRYSRPLSSVSPRPSQTSHVLPSPRAEGAIEPLRSPRSPESAIYLPSVLASPLPPSGTIDVHPSSHYPTAPTSPLSYEVYYSSMSPVPSQPPPSPMTNSQRASPSSSTSPRYLSFSDNGQGSTPDVVYPIVTPAVHGGNIYLSPEATPPASAAHRTAPLHSPPLSPLNMYLYASPVSQSSSLPGSPTLSSSSYYSAVQTPTQAFYPVHTTPAQVAHSQPASPSLSIYTTASEQTPRPTQVPLSGLQAAHSPPQAIYSPMYSSTLPANSPSHTPHLTSQVAYIYSPPTSVPSPLPFSPPVGYGFSVFGVAPSSLSNTRDAFNHESSGAAASRSSSRNDSRGGVRASASSTPVSPDSPLVHTLLRAPALNSVPLPEADHAVVNGGREGERKARRRDRNGERNRKALSANGYD